MNSNRKALIVSGGWDGHHPQQVAEVFHKILTEDGFDVEVSNTLASFEDEGKLRELSLIVPVWTMGKIGGEQCKAVCNAVAGGVGIAGCHGGMCDAFRENTDWQFMTGGQWVSHPGNEIRHTIHIGPEKSPITDGVKDFDVSTEMYYMHVDPAVKVLATCRFPLADGPHAPNGPVDMPVVWTKLFGKGRVFYNSLGHGPEVLEMEPVRTIMQRGFAWAAK